MPGEAGVAAGRASVRILLVLLLFSIALHFTGIASEIGELYFGDEGKFQAEARRILAGQPFRPWFIYPHLLFYVDAAALGLRDRLGPIVPAIAKWSAQLTVPSEVDSLVLRWVTALFGALTVVPAFRAGERLGGRRAALLGSLALVLSPIYLQNCHLNISDVPSAFFATLCFAYVARLASQESARGYALAGLAAGLAAGSKYPAGFVAVAIIGIWIGWRFRERRLRFGLLLLSGAVAAAAFLATTPSLLLFPEMVLRGSGADILFGVRQYAGAGWAGVVKESNLAYYGGLLASNFGWPVLVLGAGGLAPALLARQRVTRTGIALAWTLAFPVVFLALILRLNVAVQRNLLPVLPALAVILGVGFDLALARLERRLESRSSPARWKGPLVLGLVLAAFVPSAVASGTLLTRLARPSTRQLAAEWIDSHLPAGAALLQEVYTPAIHDPRFMVESRRFLVRFPDEQLRGPQTDYLMAADTAYARFMGDGSAEGEAATAGPRYRRLFEELPVVAAFENGALRLGPRIVILASQPPAPDFLRHAAVQLPGSWREPTVVAEEGALHAPEGGRVLFKLFLEPGRYWITARGKGLAGAGIEMIPLRLTSPVRATLTADSRCEVELSTREKYFLFVDLPKGGTLSGLNLDAISGR